jgi:hypothetical protein
MKIIKFGSTIITLFVILILSLAVSVEYYYNDADAHGGGIQSETQSHWSTGGPSPILRTEAPGAELNGAVAVAIDDKIYVIGGGPEPSFSYTNVNEIFHPVPTEILRK